MPGFWRPKRAKKKTTKQKQIIKAVRSTVKNEIHKNIENKYINNVQAGAVVYSDSGGGNGSMFLLNGLTYGGTPNNRIGNTVRMMRLRVRGLMIPTYSLLADPTVIRIIIFKVKIAQNNASAPIANLLFDVGVANANAIFASHNINYVPESYQILYDRTFVSNLMNGPAATTNSAPQKVPFDTGVINLRGTKVEYTTNTGNATDIAMNQLWILVTQDHATATNRDVIYFHQSLLEFEDA